MLAFLLDKLQKFPRAVDFIFLKFSTQPTQQITIHQMPFRRIYLPLYICIYHGQHISNNAFIFRYRIFCPVNICRRNCVWMNAWRKYFGLSIKSRLNKYASGNIHTYIYIYMRTLSVRLSKYILEQQEHQRITLENDGKQFPGIYGASPQLCLTCWLREWIYRAQLWRRSYV